DRGRARRDRLVARDAVAADGAAGHLLTRRDRGGLDVPPLVERYRSRLPIEAGDPVVSLYEGSTPLVHADALSSELGVDLWLKLDGMNPTGPVKRRRLAAPGRRA